MTVVALTLQLFLDSTGGAHRLHFHHRGAIKPQCCCYHCIVNQCHCFLSVNSITTDDNNISTFQSSGHRVYVGVKNFSFEQDTARPSGEHGLRIQNYTHKSCHLIVDLLSNTSENEIKKKKEVVRERITT